MNRKPLQTDESWENDAVWKLLDQTPPASAGPRFVDNTVRAARLAVQARSWWSHVFSPLPLAGLAGAAAALVVSMHGFMNPVSDSQTPIVTHVPMDPRAAEIQDIAETETLIAAVDQMDKFSDNELVTLIGF